MIPVKHDPSLLDLFIIKEDSDIFVRSLISPLIHLENQLNFIGLISVKPVIITQKHSLFTSNSYIVPENGSTLKLMKKSTSRSTIRLGEKPI